MDGGAYRGTVPLNVTVPRSDRELVLLALDLWERACELRVSATIDHGDPFWLPPGWRLTTDVGTSHSFRGGGGGGGSGWHVTFDPALPENARELRVHIGPDRQPGGERVHAAPAEPTLVVPLAGFPPRVKEATATLVPGPRATVGTPARGTPGLDGVPAAPERVVPLSVRLDDVGGRDVCVLWGAVWHDFFHLHLGGSGSLPGLIAAGAGDSEAHARWSAAAWDAEDDVGGRYVGQVRGSHSGFPWSVTARLVPALDPTARSLRLRLPNPFGAGRIEATVGLPAG